MSAMVETRDHVTFRGSRKGSCDFPLRRAQIPAFGPAAAEEGILNQFQVRLVLLNPSHTPLHFYTYTIQIGEGSCSSLRLAHHHLLPVHHLEAKPLFLPAPHWFRHRSSHITCPSRSVQ